MVINSNNATTATTMRVCLFSAVPGCWSVFVISNSSNHMQDLHQYKVK